VKLLVVHPVQQQLKCFQDLLELAGASGMLISPFCSALARPKITPLSSGSRCLRNSSLSMSRVSSCALDCGSLLPLSLRPACWPLSAGPYCGSEAASRLAGSNQSGSWSPWRPALQGRLRPQMSRLQPTAKRWTMNSRGRQPTVRRCAVGRRGTTERPSPPNPLEGLT